MVYPEIDGLVQLFVRDGLVNEAPLGGGLGIDPAGKGTHFKGPGRTHQARQEIRRTRIQNQPHIHKNLDELGRMGRHTQITGQSQGTASSGCHPVDASYDGLGHLAHGTDDGIVALVKGFAQVSVLGILDGFEVLARTKGLAGPGQNHHPNLIVAVGFFEG